MIFSRRYTLFSSKWFSYWAVPKLALLGKFPKYETMKQKHLFMLLLSYYVAVWLPSLAILQSLF